MNRKHPYVDVAYPIIMAHQGDSAHAPSNTMVAFQRAVDVGAEVLELDVHWTKDGVIVVSHDDTVDRMSNGQGAIRDMTLAELRRLDYGYRFTPDGGQSFPFRGMGIQIATLREVMDAFPKTRVNMDIKPVQPGSIKQLLTDIHDCHAFDRVLVASFHHTVLTRVRQASRYLATSASPVEVARFRFGPKLSNSGRRKYPFLAVQVPAAVWQFPVVTDSFVAKAHESDVHVHVWTVDDVQEMDRLLCLGVDGIVTNRPARGVKVRNSFVDLQSVQEG